MVNLENLDLFVDLMKLKKLKMEVSKSLNLDDILIGVWKCHKIKVKIG